MVSSAPTAAQSQAAEAAAWLSELRRWLHLGREGVIIVIRDAQRPRLRELMVTLDELEPGFVFTDDPAQLLAQAPGSLVLLALRREHLDRLNLNRPVFAERSLRVVVWAEGELATQMKFLAPDLHDWVSHFVRCPEGVPEFALRGLEQGLRWWPGAAWTGPGLEMALGQALGVGGCMDLDPGQDYSSLVVALQAEPRRCVVWRKVETSVLLWRLRWAIAEARHEGAHVLDNPRIGAPGWYPVSSDQLDLRDTSRAWRSLRDAALAELEPGGSAPVSEDAATIERVGLLQGIGPELRALHETPAVEAWRRELVRRVRSNPDPRERPWSRHEQAMFAGLERRRKSWPDRARVTWAGFGCEHWLWVGADDTQRMKMAQWAAMLGQHDITERWQARWDLDLDLDESDSTAESEVDFYAVAEPPPVVEIHAGARDVLILGHEAGWEMPLSWRSLIVQVLVMGERTPAELPDFLARVRNDAVTQLGEADPQFLFIARILGLAAGTYADSNLALSYLGDPARVAVTGRYPLLAGAELEVSVVLAMLGRFEGALAQFERSPAAEFSDIQQAYERFHLHTRAALGRLAPNEISSDGKLGSGEGSSERLDSEGRRLLASQLVRLGKIAQDGPIATGLVTP